MMDATDMYPEGFHPVQTDFLPSLHGYARPWPRILSNVKYYYVDFGISVRFVDGVDSRLVLGRDCQDQEVPELSQTIPYDPLKVDVFILGNVFRKTIYAVRARSGNILRSDNTSS